MSVLKWDQVGERLYQTGVKKGVLYPQVNKAYPKGVAWNGLTGFTESPDGAEANDIYADDIKYLSIRSTENFKCTISAYTYPDEFAECNGEATLMDGVTIGQQPRKPFGFSCVTTVGNDTEFDDHGYIIHLVWGASASPSEEDHQTINDSPEAIEFSWEIDTIPVAVDIQGTKHKATAHMEINSTKATDAQMKAIEAVLYGTENAEPRLPLPGEVVSIMQSASGGYVEFEGTEFTAGTTYYERTGTAGNYIYAPTSDSTYDPQKTYYILS